MIHVRKSFWKKKKKNSEVFHVKKKKRKKNKKNAFLELEQTLSSSCVHLVQNLIVIAWSFISNAESTSDVGDTSTYFYISQISNRLGSIKLLN